MTETLILAGLIILMIDTLIYDVRRRRDEPKR